MAIEGLTRMATLFGRGELMPVVEGLQAELRQALDRPEAADAHRIAGLAGTLGFADASASWQAVDQGSNDVETALRDSRTALIAIDDWLQQEE
jgi:hypothetical protein